MHEIIDWKFGLGNRACFCAAFQRKCLLDTVKLDTFGEILVDGALGGVDRGLIRDLTGILLSVQYHVSNSYPFFPFLKLYRAY